jgi:hypothetical protein
MLEVYINVLLYVYIYIYIYIYISTYTYIYAVYFLPSVIRAFDMLSIFIGICIFIYILT